MSARTLDYNPALDGLRALAVIVVIIYHWDSRLMPGGWAGVDVFFTLSGYLITRLLMTEIGVNGSIDLKRFYWRRAIRLMPAFLVMLAVVFVLAKLTGDRIIKQTFFAATYTMNWARAFEIEPGVVLGHSWSLAIEEQFYLLWPLMLGFIIGKKAWRWVAVALLTCVAWRTVLITSGASLARTSNGFDTHADTLLIGVLLALVVVPPAASAILQRWSIIPVVAILASALLLPNGMVQGQSPVPQAIASPIIGVLTAAVIVAVEQKGALRDLLSLRLPVYIGVISYALYLWHYPLLQLLGHGPLAIALSIAAAIVSRYLVELPARRFRDRVPWVSRSRGSIPL